MHAHHVSLMVFSKSMLTIALAGALTACGGGGGNDGDTLTSSSLITITEENARQVAGMATEVNDVQANGIQQSQSALSAQSNEVIALDTLVRARAVAMANERETVSETINCTQGGTLTISLTLTGDESTGQATFAGTMNMSGCSWDGRYRTTASLQNEGDVDLNTSAVSLGLTGRMSITEIATSEVLNISDLISATNIAGNSYTSAQTYKASGSMINDQRFLLSTPISISGSVTGANVSYPTAGMYRIDGGSGSYLTIRMDSSGSGVYIAVNGGNENFVPWNELETLEFSEEL